MVKRRTGYPRLDEVVVTHINPARCPPGWLEGPYDETKPPWVECRLATPRDPTPVEWTDDEQQQLPF